MKVIHYTYYDVYLHIPLPIAFIIVLALLAGGGFLRRPSESRDPGLWLWLEALLEEAP